MNGCQTFPEFMSLRRHARQVVLAFVLALNACFGAFAQECEIRLMVANTSGFEVRAVGPRDEQFVLEWSTNLVSWATSETNQFEGCEQPVAPNYTPVFPPQTFYRVRRYEPGEGCAIGVCFKEIITNAIACPVYGPPDLATNRNASIPTGQTPVTTLRLTINVLAEDDGSNPAVPLSSVGEQVATLNADFLPHRIQFVAAVQVVTSSQFRGVASVADAQAMKQQWANNPAAQHNVFVTSVPLTLFFGYSTYPWDTNALAPLGGTVVNAQRFGRNEATLTHELGHALGLWHTHHGVTANEVNECSVCWERADALNSDGTGDRCSDTPLALIDGNGHAIGTNDVCSARPWPVSRLFNFMSAAPWFGGGFTAQQAGRMHGWITN